MNRSSFQTLVSILDNNKKTNGQTCKLAHIDQTKMLKLQTTESQELIKDISFLKDNIVLNKDQSIVNSELLIKVDGESFSNLNKCPLNALSESLVGKLLVKKKAIKLRNLINDTSTLDILHHNAKHVCNFNVINIIVSNL